MVVRQVAVEVFHTAQQAAAFRAAAGSAGRPGGHQLVFFDVGDAGRDRQPQQEHVVGEVAGGEDVDAVDRGVDGREF